MSEAERADRAQDARIRVLLVDDHPVVLIGLRAALEDEVGIEVVGDASDGHGAIAALDALRPDVVLMDIRMPRLDGIEATARIVEHRSSTKVVVLTTSDGREDVVQAAAAGAVGYVLKHAPRHELVRAIHDAAAGRVAFSPEASAQLVAELRRPSATLPTAELTSRELDVLKCAARGLTNLQIGRELFVAEATVKTHLQRVFDKLDTRDRTGAVTTAIRLGLFDPDQI